MNPLATDQVGQTLKSPMLLHNAVINSSLTIITDLLDNGADINAEHDGKYCLTQAADVTVLELLLSRGADPNIKIGSNPFTYPLHTFLSKEFKRELKKKRKKHASGMTDSFLNKEIMAFVQCLLEHEADVNLTDAHGQTAMHIAAGKAHTVHIFTILVNAGADVNIVDNSGQSPIHICVDNKSVRKMNCLLRNKAQIDLKDHYGRTALQVAAANTSISAKMLNILIDSGADVNTTDNDGETPLSNAVVSRSQEKVKILIDAGADINFVRKLTGQTVLFDASNYFILEMLLDNGADISAINGESPLNSLLAKSYIGIPEVGVKRLIEAGCDVNHVNENGDSVLISATSRNYVDISLLELLVEKGANVTASGKKPPYKTAVIGLLSHIYGRTEETLSCVEYLIDLNANIDNVHFSIMHVLITFGRLSLIPKFISRGCAPTYLQVCPYYSFLGIRTHISPLVMALLVNQSGLARYFISIKYLIKSDIAILNGESDIQRELEEKSLENSLDLLKTFGRQPLPLETLCSVFISDILGPFQDRSMKIQKLELTQPAKDALLFKNVGRCLIKDVGKDDFDLRDMSEQFFFYESFEVSRCGHRGYRSVPTVCNTLTP